MSYSQAYIDMMAILHELTKYRLISVTNFAGTTTYQIRKVD